MPPTEGRFAALTNPHHVPEQRLDLTQLCGERIKGFSLLKLLETMNEHEPGLAERWRATLPDLLRGSCDPRLITSVSWVAIELYYDAVLFTVREKLHGDPVAAAELGRRNAEREIGAFFRFVLGFASPATVLQLSGRFWRSYYDRSRMVVVRSDAHSCTVRIEDWSLTEPGVLQELTGALLAWMEAGRARDVRSARLEIVAPRTVEIDATWT